MTCTNNARFSGKPGPDWGDERGRAIVRTLFHPKAFYRSSGPMPLSLKNGKLSDALDAPCVLPTSDRDLASLGDV